MVYKSLTVEQKKNQQQQRWQRQGVVDKPWVIDGLWQNGVEF